MRGTGLLATNLPLLPRRLQLLVPFRVDPGSLVCLSFPVCFPAIRRLGETLGSPNRPKPSALPVRAESLQSRLGETDP